MRGEDRGEVRGEDMRLHSNITQNWFNRYVHMTGRNSKFSGDCGIFAEKHIANHIKADHIPQSEPLEWVRLVQAASHARVPMVSCEPDRTPDHSEEDLRWQMACQRISVGRSYKDITESLNVNPAHNLPLKHAQDQLPALASPSPRVLIGECDPPSYGSLYAF